MPGDPDRAARRLAGTARAPRAARRRPADEEPALAAAPEEELDAEAEETLAQLEDRSERGAADGRAAACPGFSECSGVNALFSTAYGNVGSSIYYALGLVASFALGLTPIVFVLTGVIFYLTAATYAEATAMYPEAGGSSSFARHAFNEFWSFFAAWGQMLNYIITIAISAFFVPHYIGGLFWPCSRRPRRATSSSGSGWSCCCARSTWSASRRRPR